MRMRKHAPIRLYGDQADRVIAIDPGLTGTGWALWHAESDSLLPKEAHLPIACGTCRAPKEGSLAQRSEALWVKLFEQLTDKKSYLPFGWRSDPTFVFIEIPQHFGSSARGIAAQSGGIYDLTFLVGYLAAKFVGCSVITFTPNEWKGQLPKDVVERRVRRIIGDRFDGLGVKSHAVDAVGLGLFAIGKLK